MELPKITKEDAAIFIVKSVVVLSATLVVGVVATAAIKGIVPIEEMTKNKKVMTKIGTVIISSMVADQAGNYVGLIVDDIVRSFKIAIAKRPEVKKDPDFEGNLEPEI